MQKLSSILLVIFCWLQYSLWFGKNGVNDYLRIKNELAELKRLNTTFKMRNKRLFAEIDDLNYGRDAIEERARTELGMIISGESFYHIVDENSLS